MVFPDYLKQKYPLPDGYEWQDEGPYAYACVWNNAVVPGRFIRLGCMSAEDLLPFPTRRMEEMQIECREFGCSYTDDDGTVIRTFDTLDEMMCYARMVICLGVAIPF